MARLVGPPAFTLAILVSLALQTAAHSQDVHDDTDRAPFLNAYVGRYQLSERFFLEIQRVGDALYVQATGQAPAQLTPRSETEFVIVGTSLRLIFQADPITQQVTHLIFEQGGFGRRAEKLEAGAAPAPPAAITLDSATLARYVGSYEEQAGFTIDITLDDGQLRAGFTGTESELILPETETDFFFEHSSARLVFDLDATGRPARLIYRQGGSDIEMDRLPD